ncbi:amylo-alpha-1,6-glucosidase [Thermosediminibacter oceani]|uniref:Amylo-alpha-16-glucosidase n=1 Tax=Thermosediminibacter oceani (strain ATCC BAA-1034 / DSM 16646 / JW/IW-1228P) TaxID=555079 RepID=D9RYP3_THEOJ|nr:amylo-alpha-1,6-glucosidase [Thermosediminibacter oceani]ADL08467.1 Amylo-alpha-16-glucosidase [Thermosediminibacter oceani DSM 16646]
MHKVIKEDGVFVETCESGDIEESTLGMFYQDTRYLSKYELKINGKRPVFLSASAEKNYFKEVYLADEKNEVLISRKSCIYKNTFNERIRLTNYGLRTSELYLTIELDADFKHMFEVRGFAGRKGTGKKLAPVVEPRKIILRYTGSDNILRSTVITFSRNITSFKDGRLGFSVELGPKESFDLCVCVHAGEIDSQDFISSDFEKNFKAIRESYDLWFERCTKVFTDSSQFNNLYKRSLADLRMLLSDFGEGPMAVAGIPWFAVPFGRDSIITGIQALLANTEIARGTLGTMARYQGQKLDPWSDEEPGKIMHELRQGELVNTKEVPFGPYYGTLDATPLFLILLSEYYNWTGDKKFFMELFPAAEKALKWMEQYGDRDGDSFLEYIREKEGGLVNQGWKDSKDSVVFSDGRLADPPIALAEIQGYAYDALMRMARIYGELGKKEKANGLLRKAAHLKERFHRAFWMEDKKYFAEALDGEKRKVDSITSNPGHCLWSGMLEYEKAVLVADRLLSDELFSGWGIRTMSCREAAYNPASYHNGSVWPHDNSLIALGLARYGFKDHLKKLISGMIAASEYFEYCRLPELFCGFSREDGGPVRYPVACSPQAWAAATPIALLQAMLGMRIDAAQKCIELNPALPEDINHIEIRDMLIGGETVDFAVHRIGGGIKLEILRSEGINIIMKERGRS